MSSLSQSSALSTTQIDGAIAVAVCATLSLVATSSFFAYLAALAWVRYRDGDPQGWASRRLAFSDTPFGVIFINLIVADFIQASGFALNYMLISTGNTLSHPHLAIVQAVLIQVGDVAAALTNFLIALQTFLVLSVRYRPSFSILPGVLASLWSFTVFLALIGPISREHGWENPGGFYEFAGQWNWISPNHEPARLYLHYLWIFLSLGISSVLYIILFFRLRAWNTGSTVSVGASTMSMSDRPGGVATPRRSKTLDRAARHMLLYPIIYSMLTMPLSIYRLAGMEGHRWSHQTQAACGSIFTLAGFSDLLLFGLTRNVLAPSKNRATFGALRVQVQQDTIIAMESQDISSSPRLVSFVKPVPTSSSFTHHPVDDLDLGDSKSPGPASQRWG